MNEGAVTESRNDQISHLLSAWNRGEDRAESELIPLVYGELRRLASSIFAQERREHTLQPTALVHETYLRLIQQKKTLKNRSHFFAIAAQTMHRILIDHARRQQCVRRGGDRIRIAPEEIHDFAVECPQEILRLEEALKDLARVDPFKATITELRFFSGFTEPETAKILGCSTATVTRHWRVAKAWLYRELTQDPSSRSDAAV